VTVNKNFRVFNIERIEMKRYTHAWIALRAIDRLDKLADNVLQKAIDSSAKNHAKADKETDPKKKKKLLQEADDIVDEGQSRNDSIKNLQTILRKEEFVKLVVQGTWIPDNVIRDNSDGHIWKYEPPLRKGEQTKYRRDGGEYEGYVVEENKKKTYYRTDHAQTSSLCYNEARNTYAWEKPWLKSGGFLADRCEAVHQTARDFFLFQEDEMHKLAGTLLVKYGDELFDKKEEVKKFLIDPVEVKVYYDMKNPDETYVHRDKIIQIRNQIGVNSEITAKVKKCLEAYRVDIKNHITKFNGMRFINNESSFFPMFINDDQIVLELFALSHYLADAHMPLHCDSREFSLKECSDIHGNIEEEWESWIIEKGAAEELTNILSESERAEKFLKNCFNSEEPSWKNYKYPAESILKKFDDELGKAIWDDRDIQFYDKTSVWDELVGITYASYCIASRLIAFNDKTRVVPKGKRSTYNKDFDGEVKEIKGDEWRPNVDGNGIEEGLKGDTIRKQIYNFAVKNAPDNAPFLYLSLLTLVDAVNCVAKIWGKVVKDHLDITCQKD
jgi:hypothetical protein